MYRIGDTEYMTITVMGAPVDYSRQIGDDDWTPLD